jgi:hypothetical protein
MPNMDRVYKSFYGSGYLIFDDDDNDIPTLMTGYKLVIDIDDFSGGGFLLGLNEEDSYKAAQLGSVRLSLGTVGQYLSLVVGRHDGDWLPVLALGLTTGPYIIEPFE